MPGSERSGVQSYPGRRAECPHCGHRITVRGNQTWKARFADARVRVVAAERDGALVEQIGREHLESRWTITYRDLLATYRKEAQIAG